MIKTLSQALRMDKERFKVPKSVQQAIPIQRIWPDGIFQQGTKFSKTYRFTDINYYIASKDNKTEMFLDYSELLNSLDSGIVPHDCNCTQLRISDSRRACCISRKDNTCQCNNCPFQTYAYIRTDKVLSNGLRGFSCK